MDRRAFLAASAATIGGVALPRQTVAAAETNEVSIARGFAIPHLPLMIVEHQKLYEKHLAAAGLPNTKVTWGTIGSGSVMNDALLSNTLSFATGGPPPMITLWSKTKGSPIEVRGVCGQALMPLFLNTRNPNVKTIKDFGPNDRIAVAGIKTSIQAILLQMEAARQFGPSDYGKLDERPVGMNAVDATTAVRSPNSEVTANVSIAPFQYEELKVPGIHRVFSSYDVVGEPHTFSIVWTTSRFRDQNPLSYKAFLSAIREATALIQNDKPMAAKIYLDLVKAKNPIADIIALLNDPDITYSMTPKGTMKFAEFMHKVGTIKQAPASWKDIFFPEVHDLQGS